jgi:hypothetical protein
LLSFTGRPIENTWTLLSQTAEVGTKTISVQVSSGILPGGMLPFHVLYWSGTSVLVDRLPIITY